MKEKLLAFVATDDKKTAKRLRKKSDRAKWDHVQFAMLKSGESRGVGMMANVVWAVPPSIPCGRVGGRGR